MGIKGRRSFLLVGLLALAFLLSACGGNGADTAGTDIGLDAVTERGVLRIGTDDTYPPMEYRDETGNLVGFDIDLGDEIGRRMGLTVEWVPSEWDGLIASLQQGRFDLIMSSMNINEERSLEVDFAQYAELGQYILVPAGNPLGIDSLESLTGTKIAVQLATTNEAAARSVPDTEVITYDDFETALLEVNAGRADATILDTPVAAYYVFIEPNKYELVGDQLDPMPIGAAVHQDAADLRDAVADAVAEIETDGTMTELMRKWRIIN